MEELYYEYYGYNTVTEEPLLTREEAEYVKGKRSINRGLYRRFFILSYVDPETGEPSGIFPDLARKIGEISGLEFILSAEPSGSRPEDLIKADALILQPEFYSVRKRAGRQACSLRKLSCPSHPWLYQTPESISSA